MFALLHTFWPLPPYTHTIGMYVINGRHLVLSQVVYTAGIEMKVAFGTGTEFHIK